MTKQQLVGLVTDDTPTHLEYGDYRGYVLIDADTGEWVRNVSKEERARMTLGEPVVYNFEYADLRPGGNDRDATACAWCGVLTAPDKIDSVGFCVDCCAAPRDRRDLFGPVGGTMTCGVNARHYEVISPEIVHTSFYEPPTVFRCWGCYLARNRRDARIQAVRSAEFAEWVNETAGFSPPFKGLEVRLFVCPHGDCMGCWREGTGCPECRKDDDGQLAFNEATS